jgi:hypothetical protein
MSICRNKASKSETHSRAKSKTDKSETDFCTKTKVTTMRNTMPHDDEETSELAFPAHRERLTWHPAGPRTPPADFVASKRANSRVGAYVCDGKQ